MDLRPKRKEKKEKSAVGLKVFCALEMERRWNDVVLISAHILRNLHQVYIALKLELLCVLRCKGGSCTSAFSGGRAPQVVPKPQDNAQVLKPPLK
jgi:hypothetical protein